MKKICICTTISLTMKIFVIPTVKYLYEKCGYNITLICNPDKEFEKTLPDYINFIPVNMNRGIDFSALNSIVHFIKIFREQKFDLVQYSTPNAACYASIAAKICKVPVRLYCQWGIRYVGLSGVGRSFFKLVEKMICKNSTDIRAQSFLNLKFAVEEGLYKKDKALVVGKGGTVGVDSKVFDISQKQNWKLNIRRKYSIAENEFVYGYSGRITIDKGCRELLTAFREIEKTQKRCKLFIVGILDESCGIDIELIEWAKKSKNVIFTGMIEGSNMCQYYSAMDVLVHPTYREGFGMVIQEAGALAVSVITTNVPGASEVLEDGISAIHVTVRNSFELMKAMLYMYNNQEKVTAMGINAYKRTMDLYERKIMLENQKKDYDILFEKVKRNEV